MRAASAMALALLGAPAAAGCASALPAGIPAAYAPVPSRDGRYRLRIDAVLRNLGVDGAPGSSVQAQGAIEPPEGDAVFADMPSVTRLRRLVGADGRTIPVEEIRLRVDPVDGRWSVSGIPVRPEDDRIRLLELECRVIRVTRWREFAADPVALAETRDVACPPAMLRITAEPGRCWVASSYRGEWRDLPAADRLARLLTHVYFAGAARVVDRRGDDLRNSGGAGTGGTTACMFLPPSALEPGRGYAAAAVAYPVTLRVRVPEEFTVDTAVFRIGDLPLPPVAGR